VPPSAPIDLGQIQQGFRTVKFFEVQNTGDGPLTFDGTISGPDVVLFGLPDPAGSVTNPPSTRTYTAEAIAPCGNFPAGSGKVIVAISFFAGAAPSPTSKSATLTLSGHNATNFPPTQTWTFPLSVVITAPVAVDVALVVDHSGSMNDALGSRVKIDAAISASQLFVELLRPDLDDRVAVVRFDQSPDVVVPMTPVSTTAAPTQGQIRAKVATDIPPATGTTAIAAGADTGPVVANSTLPVAGGGRDDPRLSHRAAEQVLGPPSLHHQLLRTGDNGAERTAEPLREADRDRVEVPADRRRRHAARDRGVEDPRAVEVDGQPVLPRRVGYCRDLLERPTEVDRPGAPALGGAPRHRPGEARNRP